MVRASGTMRGSAVITPSTSVQIQTSCAGSVRPRIAAVRSLLPRPSVVVAPSGVEPIKPVTTGIVPCSSKGGIISRTRRVVSSSRGEALPKLLLVISRPVASTICEL